MGIAPFLQRSAGAFGKPVCRLGLASHRDTEITTDDVHHALERGVNFLNWAGDEDVFSRTIAALGRRPFNLTHVCDVKADRDHAGTRDALRQPCRSVNPPGPPPMKLVDENGAESAVGAGHQAGRALDLHAILLIKRSA